MKESALSRIFRIEKYKNIKYIYIYRERESYSALDKIIPFIKKQYGVDVASLPASKEELKAAYEKDKGSAINGAESSVINELYNQLANVRSC